MDVITKTYISIVVKQRLMAVNVLEYYAFVKAQFIEDSYECPA